MASTRADEVAEILWELKRAGKLSSYTLIARRAGFSPGSKGRAMETTLRAVRRDWPHLHWWRAVSDSGLILADTDPIAKDQFAKLTEAGFELEKVPGGAKVKEFENHVMSWPEQVAAAPEVVSDSDADTDLTSETASVDEVDEEVLTTE